jgi:hypothetical protein
VTRQETSEFVGGGKCYAGGESGSLRELEGFMSMVKPDCSRGLESGGGARES